MRSDKGPHISVSQTLARAVIITALAACLAGCGKHTPSGQTVATVNGENITQSELATELAAAGLTSSSPVETRNGVLQLMIDRILLDQQAEKDGVDKTPEFVLLDKRAHDILLAQRAVQDANASDTTPPTETEVSDYIDKHPALRSEHAFLMIDQVTFAAPRSQAEAVALAPAKTMDQLIAVLQNQEKTFQRGQITVDTAQAPDELLARLHKTLSGEPFIIVRGPLAVANVLISEKLSPLGSTEAENLAKQRLTSERATANLRQRQTSLRQDAKIQYAPGFAPRAEFGHSGSKPAAEK